MKALLLLIMCLIVLLQGPAEGMPQSTLMSSAGTQSQTPPAGQQGDNKFSQWVDASKQLVQTLVQKTQEGMLSEVDVEVDGLLERPVPEIHINLHGFKSKSDDFKDKASKFIESNIDEITNFAKKVHQRTSEQKEQSRAENKTDASLGILTDLAQFAQKLKVNITS